MQQSLKALEWEGDNYHRLSDMQYSLGMQLLGTLELKHTDTVIDAGCGSGRITAEILKRLPRGHVVGIDLGESMLATARREVVAAPGQQATFIQADLQTFIYPEPADGLFSNMALHFVHDHRQMFANMAQMLKAGGWLAAQYGSSEQLRVGRPLFAMMNAGKFGTYLRGATFDFKGANVQETEQFLLQAGFTSIQIEPARQDPLPEHRDKMREYFYTTIMQACLERLPDALKEEFRAEMQALMATTFDAPFNYLRVRARLAAH